MGDALVEEVDLARNFGFDITMSGGNMGMPAAAHKDYLVRCSFLYKEFMANMNTLIKEEKDVKKTLRELYKEKINNLRFSMYRCQHANEGHDPFARKHEPSVVSPSVWESRGNTPWESRGNTPCRPRGLDPIIDEEEDNLTRPKTAPAAHSAGLTNDAVVSERRPKTTGAIKTSTDNDKLPGRDNSIISQSSEIVAVLDPTSERTSSRQITVSRHSFTKVVRPTKIKIKHRDGKFLVKPMRDNFIDKQAENTAFDPQKTYRNYDPVNEKLALVRQITSYKTPTISSDMKINNRVPIQKSLRGEDAKLITVAEIYRNARDRKTRHFKLIARKSSKDKVNEENSEASHNNLLSVNSRPFSRKDVINGMNHEEFRSRSRANTRLSVRENTPGEIQPSSPLSPTDELAKSTNSGKFREYLKRSRTADNTDSPECNESWRENAENGISRKPGLLKVPGVGIKSGKGDSESHNLDNHRSNESSEDRYRSDSIVRRKKALRVSEVPKATEISEAYRNEEQSNVDQQPENMQVTVPPRGGRRMSIVSIASAGSFIVKLQNATKNKKNISEEEAKLSFRPPPKVASINDSSRIVKQQMRKDKELDERMAVWKRRMVNAGITSGRGPMGSMKRGSRMKLI